MWALLEARGGAELSILVGFFSWKVGHQLNYSERKGQPDAHLGPLGFLGSTGPSLPVMLHTDHNLLTTTFFFFLMRCAERLLETALAAFVSY